MNPSEGIKEKFVAEREKFMVVVFGNGENLNFMSYIPDLNEFSNKMDKIFITTDSEEAEILKKDAANIGKRIMTLVQLEYHNMVKRLGEATVAGDEPNRNQIERAKYLKGLIAKNGGDLVPFRQF